jgi:hypothetical protein
MIKIGGVDIGNQIVLNEFAILVHDKILDRLVNMQIVDVDAIKIAAFAEISKKYPQMKMELNIPEKKGKKEEGGGN